MKHLHENIRLELEKSKHSKRKIIVGFGLVIFVSIAIIITIFLKIIEEREINIKNEKLIEQLKYENVNMQKEIIEHKEKIAYLFRTNDELLMQRRLREEQVQQQINKVQQIQQQQQKEQQKEIYAENNFKTNEPTISNVKPYTQPNTNNIPRYTAPQYTTPRKMYPKYNSAKLVSDSKIEVMPDNRLKSTMTIYGRYINKPITTLECGKNERVYKIVNECTGAAFPLDRIFYSKSNKASIENINRNTHMVECLYDYENGIMHDCSVKLIGV